MKHNFLPAVLCLFFACAPEPPPQVPAEAPAAREIPEPVPAEPADSGQPLAAAEVPGPSSPVPQEVPAEKKQPGRLQPAATEKTLPAPSPDISRVETSPSNPAPEPQAPVQPVKVPVSPVFLQFSLKETSARTALAAADRKITLTVPYGTQVGALTPVFSTNGSQVFLDSEEVQSGMKPLNWTRPVSFLLRSADEVEGAWTVEVAVTPASRDSKLGTVRLGDSELMPPFDPAVASYSLFVPVDAADLPLTALPSFPKSKMTIQVNDALNPVPLEPGKAASLKLVPGENNLFLKVTAEDGRTNTYYVFVVKRR